MGKKTKFEGLLRINAYDDEGGRNVLMVPMGTLGPRLRPAMKAKGLTKHPWPDDLANAGPIIGLGREAQKESGLDTYSHFGGFRRQIERLERELGRKDYVIMTDKETTRFFDSCDDQAMFHHESCLEQIALQRAKDGDMRLLARESDDEPPLATPWFDPDAMLAAMDAANRPDPDRMTEDNCPCPETVEGFCDGAGRLAGWLEKTGLSTVSAKHVKSHPVVMKDRLLMDDMDTVMRETLDEWPAWMAKFEQEMRETEKAFADSRYPAEDGVFDPLLANPVDMTTWLDHALDCLGDISKICREMKSEKKRDLDANIPRLGKLLSEA